MNKILKVTSLTGLLTLLKMLSGFIIAKVVAIYAGPSGIAMLGQVHSITASLNGVVNAPVGSAVVRYTAEYSKINMNACIPWWRASVQWLLVILTIIIPVGLILVNHISLWLFQSTQYYWVVIAILLMLPITAVGVLITSIINGQQLFKRYVATGMISVIISTIIMVGLIWKKNLDGAILAAAIQSGLVGTVMIITSLRQPWFKFQNFWGKCTGNHKKKIGGYVIMAITSSLSVPIALIFIRKIIIVDVGIIQAGYWQAVWKISEVYLSVITMALATYYLPKLALAKNIEEIKSIIWETMKVIVPIVIFLASLVYLLRDVAITLLFTDEFRPARDLFGIQLIGDVTKIIGWIIAYPLLSKGKVLLFTCSEIYFSFQFVFLVLIFVKEYSTQGANIAYVINYISYIIFLLIAIKMNKFA